MRSARIALVTGSVAAATLALTGCQPGDGTVNFQNSSATAPASNPVDAGAGEGGSGSLTLALTEPKAVSGHINTTVTCSTGRLYSAVGRGAVKGWTVDVRVSARKYLGAGSYPAVLTLDLTNPAGTHYVLGSITSTAQLSDTEGSVSFDGEDAGRPVAGSVTWRCSA